DARERIDQPSVLLPDPPYRARPDVVPALEVLRAHLADPVRHEERLLKRLRVVVLEVGEVAGDPGEHRPGRRSCSRHARQEVPPIVRAAPPLDGEAAPRDT